MREGGEEVFVGSCRFLFHPKNYNRCSKNRMERTVLQVQSWSNYVSFLSSDTHKLVTLIVYKMSIILLSYKVIQTLEQESK